MNYIVAAITAILVSLGAYGLHAWDVDRIEANNAKAIVALQEAGKKQCDADKQITTGVSNGLDKNLSALSDQRNALRLQYTPCASVPVTGTTDQRHGSALPSKPAIADAAVTQRLYDLADEGERYRLQLKSCQDFITDTWKEQAAKQQ